MKLIHKTHLFRLRVAHQRATGVAVAAAVRQEPEILQAFSPEAPALEEAPSALAARPA